MKTSVFYLAVLILVCLAHGTSAQDDGRSDSARSLRQFNAPGRASQQRAQEADEENERLVQMAERFFGTDTELMEEVRDLDIFKKAVADPICSSTYTCTSDSSRLIVDGKEFRTLNGSCNNVDNFSWGMTGIQHLRLLPQAYENNNWKPRNTSAANIPLSNPRNISNYVHNTTQNKADTGDFCSLALFYFMQFIDHDLVKTPEGNIGKNTDCCVDTSKRFCLPLYVTEPDDGYFPQGHCMGIVRSDTVFTCEEKPFQNQLNDLTAYIDGSMIYGTTTEQMDSLRTMIGGRLIETTDRFMPDAENPEELPCDVASPFKCFEAGDDRCNVHPGLTTFHNLFVREHNRIARELSKANTNWSDERIFQEARKIVGAEIQNIVYNEMLPAMLDASFLTTLNQAYAYNTSKNPSIYNGFSIVFRYHHLMPHVLHLTQHTGSTYTSSSVEQSSVFKKPSYLLDHSYSGIDRVALGMTNSGCPVTNGRVNDAVRNKLFASATSLGIDLAAVNILRAREWGTPAYVLFREWCGLGAATTWEDLSNTHTDQDVITALKKVYSSVLDIDLWVGAVTEDKVGTSLSGKTQSCLIVHQFYNVKNGDRFFFENSTHGFPPTQANAIKAVKLSRIMCDNLDVDELPEYAFNTSSAKKQCSSTTDLPELDLSLFNESKK